MTILSLGLAYRTRIDMKLAHTYSLRTQAHYLALGGLERLRTLIDQGELTAQSVAWKCSFSGNMRAEKLVELAGSESGSVMSLSYTLRDEKAYLNVCKSDPAVWLNLPEVDAALQASVIDWIDEDDDAGPDGAEENFYLSLQKPHAAKNMPVILMRELLFIKGISLGQYVGEDLNRNLVLDENERDGDVTRPTDNTDGTLDLGLVDLFSVFGDNGKLNINTACPLLLSALPGIGQEAAEAVARYRAGADMIIGTDDDMYFSTVDDYGNVEGLSELHAELLGQYCCFSSDVFRAFSHARVGLVECCFMATIIYSDGKAQIVSVERLI